MGSSGSVCSSAGGIAGIESSDELRDEGHVCCLATCGECGGSGCSGRTGIAAECCISDIKDNGKACSDTNEAPCVISSGKRTLTLSSAARGLRQRSLIKTLEYHRLLLFFAISPNAARQRGGERTRVFQATGACVWLRKGRNAYRSNSRSLKRTKRT